MNNKNKPTIVSLLPIGVFLILYLGLGIMFEYVMRIPMGFYNVPIGGLLGCNRDDEPDRAEKSVTHCRRSWYEKLRQGFHGIFVWNGYIYLGSRRNAAGVRIS